MGPAGAAPGVSVLGPARNRSLTDWPVLTRHPPRADTPTAAESGPEHGLPLLADALREAVAERCAEVVVAGLVDSAAQLVAELGDRPRAVRLLAAAEQGRDGHPRPMPERAVAERTQTAARAALGADRYAAERATGTALTAADVQRELAEAVRAHPTQVS